MAVSYFLGMLHVLQVLVFQTMINVTYPANAQIIAYMVAQMLNIDVIDPRFFFTKWFEFNREVELVAFLDENELYEQMRIIKNVQECSFETFNPILNMGGIISIFLAILIQLLISILSLMIIFVLDVRFEKRRIRDQVQSAIADLFKKKPELEGGSKIIKMKEIFTENKLRL